MFFFFSKKQPLFGVLWACSFFFISCIWAFAFLDEEIEELTFECEPSPKATGRSYGQMSDGKFSADISYENSREFLFRKMQNNSNLKKDAISFFPLSFSYGVINPFEL